VPEGRRRWAHVDVSSFAFRLREREDIALLVAVVV
jgi:hypothetical protein